jgi:hypothetical protein
MTGPRTTPPTPEPLFQPPAVCAHCNTDRKNLCRWAGDREHGMPDYKQPKTCLLRWDPKTAPFPKNY